MPAFAMLTVSAMTLASSTYAWFSMNTQVTATGMQVKAKAEGGIVISNAKTGGTWTANSTATNSAVAELVPTSTASAATWYHAVSDSATDAKKAQTASGAYTQLTVTENAGLGSATIGTGTSAIYLVNDFFIKSSAEAVTLTDGLYINSVDVTLPQSQQTANLDKALRVAVQVKSGDKTATNIFAPVTGGETSYRIANTTDITAIAAGVKNTLLSDIKSVPAYTTESPIEVKVWVYFEGEDQNCKSENLAASTDNITVSVQFGTTQIA